MNITIAATVGYGHLTVHHNWGIYAEVYCNLCYALFRIDNPLY